MFAMLLLLSYQSNFLVPGGVLVINGIVAKGNPFNNCAWHWSVSCMEVWAL